MRMGAVLLLVALALPLVIGNNYQLGIAHQALILVLLASGYNLLLGFTGLVSFGHIALFAIGAYTSAILVVSFGLPFLVGLVAAAVLTGLTLALGEVIRLAIRGMESLTHGSAGFSGIPRPSVLGFTFRTGTELYYLLLACVVLGVLFIARLERSRFGRAFKAIRDGETAAAVCGVDTAAMKVLAFGLSAVFAGVAGGRYAHTMRFISPEFFSLSLTITLLAMVLIGGRGTVLGPVVGAVLLTVLPEWLRFVKDYYLIVFGLAIWACTMFLPQGLMGLAARLVARKGRPA